MVDKAKPDAVSDKAKSEPVTEKAKSEPVTDRAKSEPVTEKAKSEPVTDRAKPVAISAKPADPSARAKRALVYTGLGVAALGGAYVGGRLQTQGEVDKAEEQTRQRAAAEAEQVKLREQAASKVRELEGRRQLALALIALDERNFGTAQAHLAKAGSLLAESKGDAGMEELARSAGNYQLVATDDVAKQRTLLMDWTRKFDTLRPPPQ